MHHSDQRSIAHLILAAGTSARFGSPKQLVEIQGQPMLRRVVSTISQGDNQTCIVVTGAHHAEVADTVMDLGVTIIRNRDWNEGIASSILAGVAWIQARLPETSAILIALGDQPFLTAEDFQQLQFAYDGTHIAATQYPDGPGVPAIFPRSYWPNLLKLTGDSGAKSVLRKESDLVTLTLSNTTDIDLPDQL